MTNSSPTIDLERILMDNAGIIHKLGFMYANSKEDAEDLKQEIIYQLVKSYRQFRGESKVSTWVYKVALYTSMAHLRAGKKSGSLVYEIPDIIDPADDEGQWTEVLAEIKNLPPVDRSLVFLYLEEKSYAEMAAILGLTESNVGVRLTRAKQKLKNKLA